MKVDSSAVNYYPFGIALAILVVLCFSTPFSTVYVDSLGSADTVDDVILAIKHGMLARRVALIVAIAVIIVSLIKTGFTRVKPDRLLRSLAALYILWVVMSIIWAQDVGLTLTRITVFLILLLAAYVLAEHLSTHDLACITAWVCGITLGASLTAQYVLGSPITPTSGVRFGGLLHPVSQGWNCSLLALSSVTLLSEGRRFRKLLFVVLLLGAACLFLTRSRMPVMATLTGLGIFALTKLRDFRSRASFLLLLAALFALLGMALQIHGMPETAERMAMLGRDSEARNGLATLTGRIPLWRLCLTYLEKRPFLGYGYNSFFSSQHVLAVSQRLPWYTTHAHSGFLQIALDVGLTGLLLFMLLYTVAALKALRLALRNSDNAFPIMILVWAFTNLLIESTIITAPIFPTILIFCVIAKLIYWQDRSKSPPVPGTEGIAVL